jgi:hypothetical protein
MRPSAQLFRALALALPLGRGVQAAGARITDGDRAYAARDAAAALATYEAVLADRPRDYEALCKAARAATDLGEFASASAQGPFFARARVFGERAVAVNGNDAEGHFELSRAVGRLALSVGIRERVRLAVAVRTHALDALAHNAQHAGALDVLGMWNAEVMRLSAIERLIAKAFLGGKIMGEANWDTAVHSLERSVVNEPGRIVHRLDLGGVYRDVGRKEQARAQYEWIGRAPIVEFNDANYKKQAADALRGLK